MRGIARSQGPRTGGKKHGWTSIVFNTCTSVQQATLMPAAGGARHRGFLKKKLQSCVSDHDFFTVFCLIVWLILIVWLVDWFIDWLIDWYTGCSIRFGVKSFLDWLKHLVKYWLMTALLKDELMNCLLTCFIHIVIYFDFETRAFFRTYILEAQVKNISSAIANCSAHGPAWRSSTSQQRRKDRSWRDTARARGGWLWWGCWRKANWNGQKRAEWQKARC